MIPEDWGVQQLGELKPFVTSGSRGWASYYSERGDLFVRITNLTRESIYLDLTDSRFVRLPEGDSEGIRTQLKENDVLISITADIGIIGYADARVPTPAYINQHIALLRFDPAKVNSKFVSYFLASEESQRVFRAVTDTGAKAGMSLNGVQKIQTALPPTTDEQHAIATALSDMDALLDGLDRLIAKTRAIKQATMQQLLTGQTRLPGFSGEWKVKRLGDLADIRSGGTPSTGDAAAWDGTIPWCTPTDITALEGRKYLTRTNRAITEHGLSTSSAELIPAHSIVMTSRATIGECAINAVPVTTNQGFKNLVPHDSVDVEFLYYLLSTQTQGLIGLSAGSTFLEIGKTQLRQYEVKLPAEKDEQTAIATVLSDMDAEITALETRRAKTRALKQAMMQELLTGRTRLVMSDAEPVGEEAAQAEGRKANVHFLRSVLAAEIIDQLHEQPTFGHVKFEKMMFLAEHLCEVDTGSTYYRKAAGPYDNRALRSIDSQLQKQQWFEARKEGERYQYVPLAKRGGHKPYFERHFSGISAPLENILRTFKAAKTVQCEIVATLLAAWSDLLREKGTVSDEMIVHEVLHNWHEAKQRIPEDRWLAALDWMRKKGFVPKGATLP
ncbi:restriction endonuclease subunit S [Achromobacter xylosoxidans]|uniref:restriction endonuclease subunit S n=1 Tax=Alcaligenes xylosoxydans xylosoxydans TaxID=85698 RepID=UPI0022B862F4|nr:restriction endonuclease subunit S [Achromobacter xylosoxidans]MCZ8387130.1 restriction endonuclease subunit S [Achromobacter xylosoxidans]